MPQQNSDQPSTSSSSGSPPLESSSSDAASNDSGTATIVRPHVRPAPARPGRKVDRLPPWKVLLHNDDVNAIGYVVETIVELVKVNPLQALLQTLEADKTGVALLVTTHREHAELLCEQFTSKQLTVTMEPER